MLFWGGLGEGGGRGSCQLHCKDNFYFWGIFIFSSNLNNECFNLQQTTQSL